MTRKKFSNTAYRCALCGASLFLLPLFAGTSFNWPQAASSAYDFSLNFAQLRGGIVSTSLVFSRSDKITSAESGDLAMIIRKPNSDVEHFNSTLGNAIIINHHDDLISVYGNLQEIHITDDVVEVKSETQLGISGTSGWRQNAVSRLEFQIIDIRNSKSLNPRVLMPRFRTEKSLWVRGVIAMDKKGSRFVLQNTASLPAGTYTLFHQVDSDAMPFRTSVAINGVAAETILYDALIERNGKLCVRGKRYYTMDEVYPEPGTMLLAEIALTRGRNTINVLAADIDGREYQADFGVMIY